MGGGVIVLCIIHPYLINMKLDIHTKWKKVLKCEKLATQSVQYEKLRSNQHFSKQQQAPNKILK